MGMHDLGHDGDVKFESGVSFVCEYCVADAGLCSRACIDSFAIELTGNRGILWQVPRFTLATCQYGSLCVASASVWLA